MERAVVHGGVHRGNSLKRRCQPLEDKDERLIQSPAGAAAAPARGPTAAATSGPPLRAHNLCDTAPCTGCCIPAIVNCHGPGHACTGAYTSRSASRAAAGRHLWTQPCFADCRAARQPRRAGPRRRLTAPTRGARAGRLRARQQATHRDACGTTTSAPARTRRAMQRAAPTLNIDLHLLQLNDGGAHHLVHAKRHDRHRQQPHRRGANAAVERAGPTRRQQLRQHVCNAHARLHLQPPAHRLQGVRHQLPREG
mmetsp:Transcript_41254/g.123155  ORF Transcript_41254/g.123155 Transcript_41254/m.123155 type:complete len:253 (+) Transcript_41254:140-898(+)